MTVDEFEKLKKKYPPGKELRVKQGVSIGNLDLSGRIIKVRYLKHNLSTSKGKVWVRADDFDYEPEELEEINCVRNLEDKITEIEKNWVKCLAPRVSLGQVDEMQLVRLAEDQMMQP
jgi:hypothetical protein